MIESMKYKDLYKKIEATVATVDVSQDDQALIRNILETVVTEYGSALGITSGRLYIKDPDFDVYKLIRQIGEPSSEVSRMELPTEYLPIRKLRENKYIIMHRHEQGIDSNLEQFLVMNTFAAIAFGSKDQYVVSFSVAEPCDEDQLHYSLNTIRFVTNAKLKELSLQNEFMKAREIQLSLLPSYSIQRDGFDIFGKSIPATLVGGDAFDYLPISETTLGIALMDAVGHGLPAALQARDVITGLRMGIAGNIKLEFLISRLNQVIHRSNLASRFVSLFYGELDEHGHFVYCNAGHPPALLFHQDSIIELRRGGMVLGPNPKTSYKRGFVYLHTNDLIAIYSDGITEARNPESDEFGVDRVQKIILENRYTSSESIVELIFSAVQNFTRSSIPSDDQTIVIIKRTGPEDFQF